MHPYQSDTEEEKHIENLKNIYSRDFYKKDVFLVIGLRQQQLRSTEIDAIERNRRGFVDNEETNLLRTLKQRIISDLSNPLKRTRKNFYWSCE